MTHFISYPRRSNDRQGVSRRKVEVKTVQVDAVQVNSLWSLGREEFPHSLGRKRSDDSGASFAAAAVLEVKTSYALSDLRIPSGPFACAAKIHPLPRHLEIHWRLIACVLAVGGQPGICAGVRLFWPI